jgi:hypothetical protein
MELEEVAEAMEVTLERGGGYYTAAGYYARPTQVRDWAAAIRAHIEADKAAAGVPVGEVRHRLDLIERDILEAANGSYCQECGGARSYQSHLHDTAASVSTLRALVERHTPKVQGGDAQCPAANAEASTSSENASGVRSGAASTAPPPKGDPLVEARRLLDVWLDPPTSWVAQSALQEIAAHLDQAIAQRSAAPSEELNEARAAFVDALAHAWSDKSFHVTIDPKIDARVNATAWALLDKRAAS